MAYARAFAEGQDFEQFLEATEANRALWHAMARRAPSVEPAVRRIAAVPGPWRLLVLADDWCGDAVNSLPLIHRLASGAGNVELRIVGREDHPGLMERHLTNGSRSIPVVILLDASGTARGWWGPRPEPLQEWVVKVGRLLPSEERYREVRRWYARDRGATIAHEIAILIECGVAAQPVSEAPCHEVRAA